MKLAPKQLKPGMLVALAISYKGHPGLSPELSLCIGEPTRLPAGETGLVLEGCRSGRTLVHFRIAQRYAWCDADILEPHPACDLANLAPAMIAALGGLGK